MNSARIGGGPATSCVGKPERQCLKWKRGFVFLATPFVFVKPKHVWLIMVNIQQCHIDPHALSINSLKFLKHFQSTVG